MNKIAATRIMSDFNITEFFNSLAHETKFFLMSEGLLHAKGHSRQPSDSGFPYHIYRFLDSNVTLTFITAASCWLLWRKDRLKGGGGNTCFLPQSKVNEFVDDVHRGGTGEFLDHFQPETKGIPQPWEQHILHFFNDSSTAVNKYP
jgi:hypothetical protein